MSGRNVLHPFPGTTLFFGVADSMPQRTWLDICAGGMIGDETGASVSGMLADWEVFSGDNCVKDLLKRKVFSDIDISAITRVIGETD
jgi:hypothetical protein